MPTTQDNIEAAQQALTDAKAELSQLQSERIETEGRCAQAEATKNAKRSDPRAYATASARLKDAQLELERVDGLIADAQRSVRAAERALKHAELDRDAAIVDAREAKLAECKTKLAEAIGLYAAARAEFHQVYFDGQARTNQLRRAAEAAEYDRCKPYRCFSDDGFDREILYYASQLMPIGGLREESVKRLIVETMRTRLGHRAPSPGVSYGLTAQFADMVAGNYAAHLAALEADKF